LDTLRPWDLKVDPENRPPLKPFSTGEELLEKTITCFTLLDPQLGNYLSVMKAWDTLIWNLARERPEAIIIHWRKSVYRLFSERHL
jgi:hypothetical protein